MKPRLLHLDTVTSTMDMAREELLSGRVHCDRLSRLNLRGVTAQEQTAGRGQRGRVWYSPHGASLCATYYFRHGITDPQSAGAISLLAGVAAANTLRTACRREVKGKGKREEETVEPLSTLPTLLTLPSSLLPMSSVVALKWPNDLLLNDKKVGGILVELVQSPALGWVALIGIGINVGVRAFPPELTSQATSLWLAGVRDCPVIWLAEHMIGAMDRLAAVLRQEGMPAILRRWRAYDRTPGRRYRIEQAGVMLEGIAEGIDATGALLLRTLDGRLLATRSASSLHELEPARHS